MKTPTTPLEYSEIAVDLIDASATNPRRHYDQAEMEELVSSIGQHGVMEPLLVRPKSGGRYEIVCGERRWRASRELGLPKIPAILRSMDDVLMAELQMVENIARSNLDPLEESYGVERLISLGRTREQVSAALHRGSDWVQLRLDLGGLPAIALDALRDRRIRLDAAEQMLRLEPAERESAATDLLDLGEEMTNSEVKELLRVRYLEPRARRDAWHRVAQRIAADHPSADPLDDCELAHDYLRPWGDPVSPWVKSTSRIGFAAHLSSEESITWGELATGHGIRQLIVPVGDPAGGNVDILVDAKAVRDAEAAAREAGLPHTIGHREGGGSRPTDPDPEETPAPPTVAITRNEEAVPLLAAILDVYEWGWSNQVPDPVAYITAYKIDRKLDDEENALISATREFFGVENQ